MSKRKAIILSVVLEGRSQAEMARQFEVSQSWVSTLIKRYRCEGVAAYEPASRRPKTSPTRIGEPTVEAIIELRKELTDTGLDAGPDTIRWHLEQQGIAPVPSTSTIRRYLVQAGLVTPEPKKRPKSSYIPVPSIAAERDVADRHVSLATRQRHRRRDPVLDR